MADSKTINANECSIRSVVSLTAIILLALSPFFSSTAFCFQTDAVSPFDSGLVDDSSLFVPAPREILRPLVRAQKAMDEGDYERAVALIGESQNDSTEEDYLIRVPGEDGIAVSLRQRAFNLLGRIPPKDRELYGLRYGIQAKQLLDQAVANGDFLEMSRIMGRYFYTPAGYDATMLVGYYHLDQGRPLAAAFSFRRIVETPEARKVHDPEASVLLATCWMLSDTPAKAEEVLLDLKRSFGNRPATIRFMDQDRPLFAQDSEALSWLKKLIGNTPLTQNRLVEAWVMYRGNPQRNAVSGSGFPLQAPRWKVPTINDPSLEQQARDKQLELMFANAALIPSVHPIAIGNTVVIRSLNRMIGVDFKTGRRIWAYPAFADPLAKEEDLDFDLIDTKNSYNKAAVSVRLWRDSIYGQVSSNGKSIFAVPQPGFGGSSFRLNLGKGTTINDPQATRKFNELIAVDVERQGAFQWEVGGKDGGAEPKLAEAFFLGPPLPLEGSLYAICQQKGQIMLVVLNPDSGKLEWARQLASVESVGSIISNRDRRLGGATPSFSDGILVCPTGVGALVAVDISTRTLNWGFQYGSARQTSGAPGIAHDANSSSSLLDLKWVDSIVTIWDSTVIYAPADSNDLITLDLLSGKPLWQVENLPPAWTQREDSLFVACVDQRNIILVGLNFMRAISLDTGKETWRIDTSNYGRPSGHGYANQGYYFLPTSTELLLKVDLSNGTIEKSVETSGVLGNLICHQGDVISHGAVEVVSFPQDEPNRETIAAAESKGPLDAKQLSLKAQLLIQEGKIRQAAEVIEQAYSLSPNGNFEPVLVECITKLMKVDFAAANNLLEKHREHIETESKPELAAARISGLLVQADYELAFQSIWSELVRQKRASAAPVYLSNPDGIEQLTPESPDVHAGGSTRTISYARWLQARLKFLLEKVDSAEQKSFVELAVDSLNKVNLPLRKQADLFACLPNTAEMAFEKLSNANEYLLASQVQFDGDRAQRQKTQINTWIKDIYEPQAERTSQTDWNSGIVTFDKPVLETSSNLNRNLNRNRLEIIECDQEKFARLQYRYFGYSGELEITDEFGKVLTRVSVRDKYLNNYFSVNYSLVGEVRIKGLLMVVNIGFEAFAIDLSKIFAKQDCLLWHFDQTKGRRLTSPRSARAQNLWGEYRFTKSTSTSPQPMKVSSISQQGICIASKSLVCLDPITGETLWQRPSTAKRPTIISDENRLLVFDNQSRNLHRFDFQTGAVLNKTVVPPHLGSIWAAHGTKVLMSNAKTQVRQNLQDDGFPDDEDQENQNKNQVIQIARLIDFSTLKPVWEKEFSEGTVACQVQRKTIAFIEPDLQKISWIDALTGKEKAETELELPATVRKIYSFEVVSTKFGRLVFIHTSNSTTYSYTNAQAFRLNGSRYHQFWNGYLVNIDAETLKPKWDGPVRLQYFYVSQNQPYASPLLLLIRRVDLPRNMGTTRYWTQVVAMDVRNGRQMASVQTPYFSSNDYRITAEPERQVIKLQLRNEDLEFQISSESPPPGPVAMITSENSFKANAKPAVSQALLKSMSDETRQSLLQRIRANDAQLEKRREEMKKILGRQAKTTGEN